MSPHRRTLITAAAMAVALAAAQGATPLEAAGQTRGRGMGRGMMADATHQQDMQLLQALFDNRERITRQITLNDDGVSTLTESNDSAVAKMIQTHVEAMSARVKEARPIHQRDPLFREIFKHSNEIEMTYQPTPNGIRAVERSANPCVVKLIQAHAEVVSAFIANGHAEAMKNHAVPDACK